MTAILPGGTREYADVDLSSLAFWTQDAAGREASYAHLRRSRPVSWQRPVEGSMIENPDDPGYWAVLSHELVQVVGRDPGTFCSSKGASFEEFPEEILQSISSLLGMDPPRHTRLRRLISAGFTPRRVADLETRIAAQVRTIVDELLDHEECDFVEQVANRLPMWTISELIGIEPGDRESVTAAAHSMAGWNDPAVQAGRDPLVVMFESLTVLAAAAAELAQARLASPREDVMSALVHAEVDGERLTEDEVVAFFVMLAAAGNDTTRHTTSYGMWSLLGHPQQHELVLADLPGRLPVALEELVRWTSPVMTMRRTATRDTELGGQSIAEGEKVVMFYAAANRDERVFDQPNSLDVLRNPNPHIAFGGGGPHFCLGASLARMQLRLMFTELLQRVPRLEFGAPTYVVSNFTNGIASLPCRTR